MSLRNSKENNRVTEDERRRGGGTFLIGRKLEGLKINEMIEKQIKKLLTKSSESDILNRLSRETAKESSKRATKKNKKVLDKDKGF